MADTLGGLHGSLPALLRLAHRLDVPACWARSPSAWQVGGFGGKSSSKRIGLVGWDPCCAALHFMRAACSWP